MARAAYPTDLTDAQWALITPLLPDTKPLGRHGEVSLREVVNAILYINRAGSPWEMLPHDFPDYKTVHRYYNSWCQDGRRDRILTTLRTAARESAEKAKTPTADCVDNQTAKSADQE